MQRNPLSRKQLHQIQVARGIPRQELIYRSGIPAASYDALMGMATADDGKQADKLVSRATFNRLVTILGINTEFDGLRRTGVIEWRADVGGEVSGKAWTDAVVGLVNDSDLFSTELLMVEIRAKAAPRKRWQRGGAVEQMLLLYDAQNEYRIAIQGANAQTTSILASAFGIQCERQVEISRAEYREAREMIRHEVFRAIQFDALSGKVVPKYNWNDVMAAAREFGFLPDNVIDLMHKRASERAEEAADPQAPDEDGTKFDMEDVGVQRLQIVR
ncbi:hypothetical protein [Pandoraea sp. ISTKB]|uniref:hypothetical protein n=1 Tax=Pandoraea sp. ISTKB TaxID=1586708 RepID=UPI0009F338AC|nr:hypothetical protein [Pandoraea sp. ISTKB]